MPLLRSEELVRASLRLEHSRLHQLPKVLHEVWWVSIVMYIAYIQCLLGLLKVIYIFDQFHEYIKSHMLEMVLSFVNMYIMGSSQSLFYFVLQSHLSWLIRNHLTSSFVQFDYPLHLLLCQNISWPKAVNEFKTTYEVEPCVDLVS